MIEAVLMFFIAPNFTWTPSTGDPAGYVFYVDGEEWDVTSTNEYHPDIQDFGDYEIQVKAFRGSEVSIFSESTYITVVPEYFSNGFKVDANEDGRIGIPDLGKHIRNGMTMPEFDIFKKVFGKCTNEYGFIEC